MAGNIHIPPGVSLEIVVDRGVRDFSIPYNQFRSFNLVEDVDSSLMYGQLLLAGMPVGKDVQIRSGSVLSFIFTGLNMIDFDMVVLECKWTNNIMILECKGFVKGLETLDQVDYISQGISNIVTIVAGRLKLKNRVEPTSGRLKYLPRGVMSNFHLLEFCKDHALSSRNRQSGYKLSIDRFKNLHFHTLSYGKTLSDVSIALPTFEISDLVDSTYNNPQSLKLEYYYWDWSIGRNVKISELPSFRTLNVESIQTVKDVRPRKYIPCGYVDRENVTLEIIRAKALTVETNRIYDIMVTGRFLQSSVEITDKNYILGQLVNIAPSQQRPSEMTSGDFYIKAFRHRISQDGYELSMDLIKEYAKLWSTLI